MQRAQEGERAVCTKGGVLMIVRLAPFPDAQEPAPSALNQPFVQPISFDPIATHNEGGGPAPFESLFGHITFSHHLTECFRMQSVSTHFCKLF
jgi:hypothetical protein